MNPTASFSAKGLKECIMIKEFVFFFDFPLVVGDGGVKTKRMN